MQLAPLLGESSKLADKDMNGLAAPSRQRKRNLDHRMGVDDGAACVYTTCREAMEDGQKSRTMSTVRGCVDRQPIAPPPI
jgi:hypothetical protein